MNRTVDFDVHASIANMSCGWQAYTPESDDDDL
jgi:hypothetical protein